MILGDESSSSNGTYRIFMYLNDRAPPLLHFSGSGSRRPLPDNLQHHIPVLCSVVVDLFAKMRDKTPWRHGNGAVRVVFGARAHPPGPGNDRDEPVVRMKVRMTHMMRMPFVQDNV